MMLTIHISLPSRAFRYGFHFVASQDSPSSTNPYSHGFIIVLRHLFYHHGWQVFSQLQFKPLKPLCPNTQLTGSCLTGVWPGSRSTYRRHNYKYKSTRTNNILKGTHTVVFLSQISTQYGFLRQ